MGLARVATDACEGVQAASAMTGKGYGTIVVTRTGDGATAGVLGGAVFACEGNRCVAEVDTASVEISASAPANTARFTTWGAPCGTGARCTVPVDRATRDLSATFRQLLRLTLTVTGTGHVAATDLSCNGASCTGYYVKDSTVNLGATYTASGRHRIAWTGCTANGATCSVTMGAAREVTTAFIARYVVTGTLPSGDSPWGDLYERPPTGEYINVRHGLKSKEFDAGHRLTLFAEGYPTLNSYFARWTDGPCAGQGAECTFAVTGDVTIGAHFRAQ